jgi:hypothetical protein
MVGMIKYGKVFIRVLNIKAVETIWGFCIGWFNAVSGSIKEHV